MCLSASSCPDPLAGDAAGTVVCGVNPADPFVNCEATNNTMSVAQTCDAPFKVGAISVDIGCSDNGDNACGTTYSVPINGGKAVVFPADSEPDGDGASVTIK